MEDRQRRAEHIELADSSTQDQLRQIERQKFVDPNLPDEFTDHVAEILTSGEVDPKLVVAGDLLDDSPYPEVRAAVRNYDEDLPANTIRAWTIGLIFAAIGSALNMLFSMRQPSIVITTYVAQLLCHPVGLLWTAVMPNREFNTLGLKWNLNPGPWNVKEHCLVIIMANVTFGTGNAYATDVLLAQIKFYNQNWGWGWQMLLVITVSMCGFGMAGMFRRFLVDSASMIWPSTLINTSLFYALHDHSRSNPEDTNGWTIGRYKWFLIVTGGSFAWYWFPGYIAPFLSVFAFVTWIKPQDPVINQLFGGWTGLSLIPLTFDWTQISGYTLSPLIFPWHALANTLFGVVVFLVIAPIGVHYTNTFYSLYLPISDSASYDNTGQQYNVSRILTPDFELDEAAYKEYSPLFLSTVFSIAYGICFAAISAVVVHAALYHGPLIWSRFRSLNKVDTDVHFRLYSKYREVPFWWYLVLYLVVLAVSLGTVLGYKTTMTWWGYIVAMILAGVFMLPLGIIQGSTNVSIGLYVLTEFISSYMLAGRPMATMLFKAYGSVAQAQGISFVSDLKMAQYMKVPPRTVFMAQVVATLWSSVVQVAVINWALGSIDGICEQHQVNHFTCPNAEVYFNTSIVWGVIGAKRIYGVGALYSPYLIFFAIGAVCPLITWLLARKYPRSLWRFVNWPIIFGGSANIPPATPLNYISWGIVGLVFNKWLRDRWRGWWMQYNYLTSAGLDVGLALCTIIIFFALQLPNVDMVDWWGVTAPANTMDTLGTAVVRTVADGETFGPKVCPGKAPAHLPSINSTSSYWLREPSPRLLGHRSTRHLPHKADVIVIGSGIAGAFAARELVTSGKDVVMLEAREACWGATGRNGGHCKPSLYSPGGAVSHFELDTYTFLRDLVHEHSIPCDWVSAGSVTSFPTQDQSDEAAAHIAALRETDPELAAQVAHYTDSEDLKRLRLVNMAGAVYQDDAAKLWPYKLVAWVLEQLLDAGLNLQTHTPATELEKGDDGWVVHTPRGKVLARDVILATNAYTSHLLPRMKDLIYPVRAQVAALTPPRDALPLPHTHVWQTGSDVYLIQRPNGTIVLGGLRDLVSGGEVGVDNDDEVNLIIQTGLHSACHDALKLRAVGETEEETLQSEGDWTGIMGFSGDEHPWVGQVPESVGGGEGLWVAAGFTGHGMPVAARVAMAVAHEVIGHRGDITVPKEYIISDERIREALSQIKE